MPPAACVEGGDGRTGADMAHRASSRYKCPSDQDLPLALGPALAPAPAVQESERANRRRFPWRL